MVFHILVSIFLFLFLEAIINPLFEHILRIDESRIETAKIIYHFAVFSIFLTILSVPFDAVINSHENMFLVAILGIIESVLKLFVALYITIYHNDKLYMYGFLMMMIVLILFTSKLIYCKKKYLEVNFNLKKYYNKELSKKMFSFASYSLLGSASTITLHYGQGPLLNMFFGTIVNAAQGITVQISGQLNAFAVTMLKALNPIIDKSEGSGDREMMIKTSFVGIKFSFYLLILFYIPVLLEMDTIFNFWLVDVPVYTVIFCKLLLIRNLIEQLYYTLHSSISSVGDIKSFQIYNFIVSILPLPVTYYFFYIGYPAYIIYVIYLIYSLFQGAIYLYFAKKVCNLKLADYLNDVILKTILPFLIIISISYIPHYFITDDLYRFLGVGFISLIVFTITIWVIGLDTTEKNYILALYIKLKSRFSK
jgi:Na+-driven multidrug efflux pump